MLPFNVFVINSLFVTVQHPLLKTKKCLKKRFAADNIYEGIIAYQKTHKYAAGLKDAEKKDSEADISVSLESCK